MKDQHTQSNGYRELSQEEIDLMNEVKQKEVELAELYNRLSESENTDKRWLSIARTDWQTGFMAAVRSIAKPETNFE